MPYLRKPARPRSPCFYFFKFKKKNIGLDDNPTMRVEILAPPRLRGSA